MLALASLFGFNWSASSPTHPGSDTLGSGDVAAVSSAKNKRRTIINVKLKPGGLSRFGYHANLSLRSRHIALLRAARSEGFVPIIQRLNLTSTFSKNRSPRFSKIFKMDQRWLSAYYEKEKQKASYISRRTSSRIVHGASSPIDRSSKPTAQSSPGQGRSGALRASVAMSDSDDDEEDEEAQESADSDDEETTDDEDVD